MPFKAFFDGPDNYQGKFNFYTQGSSPKLLQNLMSVIEANIDELIEINLCWYLFNNKILHEFLKKASLRGIKVNIVTIPLQGYDTSNPKQLTDLEAQSKLDQPVTKYDLAKEIFEEMLKSECYPNYNIYFFPHLYVRSRRVKKFSRGKLPYSMHLKAAYLKKKNGFIIALSSSNLAVRDLVKYESMVVVEDEPKYQENASKFFADIIHNSIHIKKYHAKFDMACNTYSFIKSANHSNSFFTAPFYFDSANILEEMIINLINTAQNRIIICAQHLAAFNYEFNTAYHSLKTKNKQRRGILGIVIEMAQKGVKTTCFSQTFSPPQDKAQKFKGVNFRRPANTKNFQQFYSELSKLSNTDYYVNQNIHSKYMIIDHTLIYCTYNFTPTQFIFLDKVNIKKFVEMPDLSYQGVHCEVSGHLVIKDNNLIHSFIENLTSICNSPETIKVL